MEDIGTIRDEARRSTTGVCEYATPDRSAERRGRP
jgi:hypothetical protein